MTSPKICPWYTPEIQTINKHLWIPDKTEENSTILYNFDSKIINFESYKNSVCNKLHTTYLSNPTPNNLKKYKDITEKFKLNLISL